MFINKVVFISWSSANVFEGHAIPEVPGEEVGIQRYKEETQLIMPSRHRWGRKMNREF